MLFKINRTSFQSMMRSFNTTWTTKNWTPFILLVTILNFTQSLVEDMTLKRLMLIKNSNLCNSSKNIRLIRKYPIKKEKKNAKPSIKLSATPKKEMGTLSRFKFRQKETPELSTKGRYSCGKVTIKPENLSFVASISRKERVSIVSCKRGITFSSSWFDRF